MSDMKSVGVSEAPEEGIALCLSGGGYRAMLFHVGAIIRLNELGILKQIARISSVSGGSITAGILGLNWKSISFNENKVAQNLDATLIKPVLKLADTTIDKGAVLGGLMLPGSINDMVVAKLEECAFGKSTLQDLPDDSEGPRFIFNATNVQTGALVRMSKPYLADYRVGEIEKPTLSLARAVAASSAFPPILSPAEFHLDPKLFKSSGKEDLQCEPYTDTMVLTDGGVYDNLGLEPAWKNYRTILVSDGGGKMKPEPEPHADWVLHSRRILDLVDNQVRNLRKRMLIDSYQTGIRAGAYWGIRTDIANYRLESALKIPIEYSLNLAETPTRLQRLPYERQKKLVNWGYAVCDAAVRKHLPELAPSNPPEAKYPLY